MLAQLFHASKLELSDFKIVCEAARLIIPSVEDREPFDEKSELFDKLALDGEKFDIDDARACFAAVEFIMTSAGLYGTPDDVLLAELEQLGLPSEHSQILCSMMGEAK